MRAEAAKPRDARNEGVPSRAISHARGHLRVLRFALRTTEKRETARSLNHIKHCQINNSHSVNLNIVFAW